MIRRSNGNVKLVTVKRIFQEVSNGRNFYEPVKFYLRKAWERSVKPWRQSLNILEEKRDGDDVRWRDLKMRRLSGASERVGSIYHQVSPLPERRKNGIACPPSLLANWAATERQDFRMQHCPSFNFWFLDRFTIDIIPLLGRRKDSIAFANYLKITS